jgi:hypothetical protein
LSYRAPGTAHTTRMDQVLCRLSPMKLLMFNLFNLVSYKFYMVLIFRFYVIQIYELGLGRHDPMKAVGTCSPEQDDPTGE